MFGRPIQLAKYDSFIRQHHVSNFKVEISSAKSDAIEAYGEKMNLQQSLQQTQYQITALSQTSETQERATFTIEVEAHWSSMSALQYHKEIELCGAHLSATKIELGTIKDKCCKI